jgi:hypothetical protein
MSFKFNKTNKQTEFHVINCSLSKGDMNFNFIATAKQKQETKTLTIIINTTNYTHFRSTGCFFFYRVSEYGICHAMSRRMTALYATELPRSATRQKWDRVNMTTCRNYTEQKITALVFPSVIHTDGNLTYFNWQKTYVELILWPGRTARPTCVKKCSKNS